MGAFSGKGKQHCRSNSHDIQVLAVIKCSCARYVPRTGRFTDAKFAEPDPSVNGAMRLRAPGEPAEPA